MKTGNTNFNPDTYRDSKYSGDKVLSLFTTYAINRNNYIAKKIIQLIETDNHLPKRILEFGAGKGEFINRFSGKENIETFAVESDESYRQILSSHHTVFKTIDEAPDFLDFIFLIDVLEHLENDQAYLEMFYNKLKDGGSLFIYVPARKELFSKFDKRLGHFRRYNSKELIGKVEKAGFKVEVCRYHEMLGYIASFLHNVILRKAAPTSFSIRLYDKILVPVTNKIEDFFPPPFGKSLYLSAKR